MKWPFLDIPYLSRHTKKGPYGFPDCRFSNAHEHSPFSDTDMLGCLRLPEGLYYLSANGKGSGETALMSRLARAFASRLCDTYPFLMCFSFMHS